MVHGALVLLQFMFDFDDMLELPQEEHVDLRPFMDGLLGDAAPQRLTDVEEPFITLLLDHLIDVVELEVVPVRQAEMMDAVLERTDRLQKGLFIRTADRHDFACSLHLCPELAFPLFELVEWEAWNLGDDIVERRFECRIARAGDRIDHFIERHTDGDFGCKLCDRIARRLRSER